MFASVIAGVLALPGAAWALYSSSVTESSGGLDAATVNQGNAPTTVVSGRDVTLSWSASTLSDNTRDATSYAITKTNVTPGVLSITVNGTCSGSVAGSPCTDTGVAENGSSATSWTYTVDPFYDLWQGAPSAASGTVNVPAPSLSLTPSTVTTAGGSVSAAVSNYFDNEGLTYCLDTQTLPCGTAQLGTGTVPASGGSLTKSINIPAGESVGAHTVYAVGSLGSIAAAGLTVNPGTGTKLVITSDAFSAPTSNSAISPFTVTLEDAFGNATTSGSDITVNLSASPSSGTIFSTTQGGASTSTVTLHSSNQFVTAYFGDSTVGTPTIRASASGLSPDATQGETVTAMTADLGNATATCTSFSTTHTCTGPSVTTTGGRNELILVYLETSNSTSTTVSSVSGPFSGQASITSEQYSSKNYLFAWRATGSAAAGSTATGNVAVTFDSGTTSEATVAVDVIQLGTGASASCNATCTGGGMNSGGGKTFNVALTTAHGYDGEVAFVGSSGNTSFTLPTGFTQLGATTPWSSSDDLTVQPSASFSEGAANKDWGYIGLEINP